MLGPRVPAPEATGSCADKVARRQRAKTKAADREKVRIMVVT